ncbi:MAG: phosphopentomutase/phosphoglucosamine mutase, partial [Methanobacteriota archaeon]
GSGGGALLRGGAAPPPPGAPAGPATAAALSAATATAEGGHRPSVVVARDPRTSGPMLEGALVAGLLAQGVDVTRLGLAPTPVLAWAARDHAAGVMLTASHNPPEYGGFKFWNPDGSAFSKGQAEGLEGLLATRPAVAWDKVGAVKEDAGAVARYVDHVAGILPKSRRLKIVVDPGCGAACHTTPPLLRRLGHDVTVLHGEPDGRFPARAPEPTRESLGALSEKVKAIRADLGVAHDGDADRMVAVTEAGEVVEGDHLLCVFARALKARSVVCPVDTSLTVREALPGATITHTRIGDAFVSEEVARNKADFGGEASGSWIFPRLSLCPDGPHAAAALAYVVGTEGPLGKLVAALPRFPLRRGSVAVPNERKGAVMSALGPRLSALGTANTLDGFRVDVDDGWLLVRPSGTAPKVRISAEARTAARADELFRKAEDAIRDAVSRA